MSWRRLLVALATAATAWSGAREARAAPTVVSVTFDDTLGDQYDSVRSLLLKHAIHATFYVNSGRVNGADYMNLEQLLTLQADGNELGGHTVNHVPLLSLSPDEQRRQICIDRVNLLGLGFRVSNFAYPLSQDDASIQQLVVDCGYNSARGVGGLACSGCATGEAMPPPAPLHIRTPPSIIPTTTLNDLKSYVTTAEDGGGGWVPLVFHHACDGCNPLSVTPNTLDDFLSWLDQRVALGTTVKTVGEVMGGSLKPGVVVPKTPPAADGQNALANPSFEIDSAGAGVPDCWRAGKGTVSLLDTSDAIDGRHAMKLEMMSDADGPQRLISVQDMGQCSPTVVPGQHYTLSAWIHATASPRFIAYSRDRLGAWSYWTRSQPLDVSSRYGFATWALPAIPENADGISIGILLDSPGSLTIDELTLGASAPGSGCSASSASPNVAELWVFALAGIGMFRRQRKRRY